MFELLCNVLMFVFLAFTYFTHVIEAKIPKSYLKNPNVIHPSAWPKAIIILLLICIAVNIYKIIKKNKDNPNFTIAKFCENSKAFFKSKMFIGMLILAAAAFMLEPLGFVVTAAFIMFAYGLLLGGKKVWLLTLISCGVALLMHIIFSGLLDVTLPRGTVPFLRNFALALENLF